MLFTHKYRWTRLNQHPHRWEVHWLLPLTEENRRNYDGDFFVSVRHNAAAPLRARFARFGLFVFSLIVFIVDNSSVSVREVTHPLKVNARMGGQSGKLF